MERFAGSQEMTYWPSTRVREEGSWYMIEHEDEDDDEDEMDANSDGR